VTILVRNHYTHAHLADLPRSGGRRRPPALSEAFRVCTNYALTIYMCRSAASGRHLLPRPPHTVIPAYDSQRRTAALCHKLQCFRCFEPLCSSIYFLRLDLRSCMAIAPSQYNGLGGWASVREGTDTPPAHLCLRLSLTIASLTAHITESSLLCSNA